MFVLPDCRGYPGNRCVIAGSSSGDIVHAQTTLGVTCDVGPCWPTAEQLIMAGWRKPIGIRRTCDSGSLTQTKRRRPKTQVAKDEHEGDVRTSRSRQAKPICKTTNRSSKLTGNRSVESFVRLCRMRGTSSPRRFSNNLSSGGSLKSLCDEKIVRDFRV